MITSAANKGIKNVMLLLSKAKERRKQKAFAAEGIKMFLEAPVSRISQVYISEQLAEELEADASFAIKPADSREKAAASPEKETAVLADKLASLKRSGQSVVEVVKTDIFNKMCDTKTPQGILCVISMPEYSLDQMLEADGGLYLILEDIQDPGNLGTMIRTGEGAGLAGVIMSSHTVDIFNPKTIRATMGSIYRVPFIYVDDLADAIEAVKAAGIRTYAAHLRGENAYDKENYCKAAAFIIGNEGNGLSRETADLADRYVRIPMVGKVESLNAAIAAALLMYEAARQRRN